jgi:hypothetical protein
MINLSAEKWCWISERNIKWNEVLDMVERYDGRLIGTVGPLWDETDYTDHHF